MEYNVPGYFIKFLKDNYTIGYETQGKKEGMLKTTHRYNGE